MFSCIAVLPHSPGVVYYHLLLRRETRIPRVAPFSFRIGIWDLFVHRGQKSYTPTAFGKLWTTPGVRFNSIALEQVNSYKYLGADIDHTLTMDLFISNVCKKVNFKIYMFKKIRKYVTKYAAIMIYKQTILPYFDYDSFLMGSANQSSIANLDKYQKRAIRLIEYKPKQLR